MVYIQNDQILVIFNVDGPAVDLHGKYFRKVKDFVFLAEDIEGTQVRIDEFVAKL